MLRDEETLPFDFSHGQLQNSTKDCNWVLTYYIIYSNKIKENDAIDNAIPYLLFSHSINLTISSKIHILSDDKIHGSLSFWSWFYYVICNLSDLRVILSIHSLIHSYTNTLSIQSLRIILSNKTKELLFKILKVPMEP